MTTKQALKAIAEGQAKGKDSELQELIGRETDNFTNDSAISNEKIIITESDKVSYGNPDYSFNERSESDVVIALADRMKQTKSSSNSEAKKIQQDITELEELAAIVDGKDLKEVQKNIAELNELLLIL